MPRNWVNLLNGELKIDIVWGALGLEFGFGRSLDMRLVFWDTVAGGGVGGGGCRRANRGGGGQVRDMGGKKLVLGGREVTEEAAVEMLPSIPEMPPGALGVVALAEQQQHMVGLKAVHTHGRSHLHVPQALD